MAGWRLSFGAWCCVISGPLAPRRTSVVKGTNVTDPPLQVDELPGWLDAWRQGPDGWLSEVTYNYPVHGLGMTGGYIDWLPAERLRLNWSRSAV